MIDFDFSEINAMVAADELDEFIEEELEETFTDIYTDLTDNPPVGTPIDTRVASNSWQLDFSDPKDPEIYTTNPYMNRLNHGHSSQTPAGFVERACDKASD